jgi:CHAT domain-containing protein/tetratricopeptide (TPR) repeat protein
MVSLRLGLVCAAGLALTQAVPVAPATQDQTWAALDARATELYDKGDLPHAIDAADAALRRAGSPREIGRSLDRLGFLYYTSGKLADGEQFLRRSLEVRESAFGVDSLDYAETANDLAMLLRDLRRMDEASTFAERAVATRERLLGKTAVPLAESLNTLATVYGLAGNYAKAVLTFERAVAIHESLSAPDRATEEYGTLCVNLAGTYQRLGKYDASETTFLKGLEALKVKPGVTHPAYAASLLAYAALEVELGRYGQAERLYDEGGRLVLSELGAEHPIYATFLNNRGFLYQSIGNAAAAAASYQQSLDLKRKLYGPDSPLAVSTLRNLAHLTYSQDHRAGERLLAEAVGAYARMPRAPPFDFTSVLVGLARAQRDRNALPDARGTATRALEVSRAGLGEKHPLFAAATRELGLTLAASGDQDAAEQYLLQALTVAEQVHGPLHPDVAGFLNALADFYVGQHKYAVALPLYSRSLDLDDRFWTDVLEIGSESFKAASMATANDPIPTFLAFQRAAPALPGARALAFEAVTRRKGRIIEQVRSWRQRLEESASPAVGRDVREWQAFVECRTSLTLALGYRDLKPRLVGSCTLPGTDLEGRYEKLLSDLRSRWTPEIGAEAVRAIGVLQVRADKLEGSLNRVIGGLQSDIRGLHATVDDIRGELGADEALVEIVSYAGQPSTSATATRRYGAFVLDKTDLTWADLGTAQPIDAAVADLLAAAHDWSVSVANHEDESAQTAMRTAQGALTDLSRRIWRPLKPRFANAQNVRRLRIAPDGALNLVPFEALSDGAALIDRYTITYVPAGRDVLHTPSSIVVSPPVVVVSPGAGLRRTPAASNASAARSDVFAPLSGADGEVADVRRLLPGTAVFTGGAATEEHVKSVRSPALLHIVGHGVVRGNQDCQAGPCLSASIDASTQAMSLAAIVLEEAYGRGAGSQDDGMLTALELQNMHLGGTEMLVLSQCQMASGLASVGEGVYGMRRAAAIAGVHTFVAPLWNVEDRVQRRLMKRFYEGLASGEARADALRRAKLLVRRTPATNSFLYWAPVILSGSPGALPASLFRH